MNTKKLSTEMIVVYALLVISVALSAYNLVMFINISNRLDNIEKQLTVVQVTPIPTVEEEVVATQTEEPVKELTLKEMQNGKPFVFVGTNVNHPVVKIMELGFWDACLDYDLHCKFMAVDGNDIAGLVAQMDTITADNTSGVTSFIYDVAFHAPTLNAIEDGIPVVNWHAPMTKEELPGLLAWVSADIEDYATRAALEMAKAISCEGTVAITQGSLNATETPVAETFAKVLREACPDVNVLQSQEEGFDPPVAIAKATAILTGNPDITGAFSTTGAGATTWSKAAEDRGKNPGDIKIIAMDYSVENLDLVKSGWVHALVGQPLYEENYRAVELLVAFLKGEEVPYENPLECPIIMLADIDKYYEYAEKAANFDALRTSR